MKWKEGKCFSKSERDRERERERDREREREFISFQARQGHFC